MKKLNSVLGVLLLLLHSVKIFSSLDDYYIHTIDSNPSNIGLTGLLEIPNARFMQPASLRFNFSSSFPNEFTSVTATPFSWMEASYRYTEVKNKRYGPSSYSGNQSWKDKAFDLKIKLMNESKRRPAIALGLIDLAGTGIFSSEYVVMTKEMGNFDISLGLGWGLLGSANNFSNPLKEINKKFDTRAKVSELGGDFNLQNYFRGNTALFGGIEYDLKKYGLRFVLEYDTTNPDINAFNPVNVQSRLNFGVNYPFSENLNAGFSFERGSNFRLFFSFKGNFLKDTIKKPNPKSVIKLNAEQQIRSRQDPSIFYRSLNKSLQDETIYIQGATLNENSVDVSVATPRFTSIPRTVGRTSRIVSALSDEKIEQINVIIQNGDLEVAEFKLNRKEFDSTDNYRGSVRELLGKSSIKAAINPPLYESADFKPRVKFPEFTWSMSPALKHQIGGPEGFYLGQLWWRTDTTLKFRRGLSLYTTFGINIYDTFNDFNNPSDSKLPHVRSDIQDYLSEGKNNLQKLKLEYMFSPVKDVFVRADAGLIEEMFGGIGGEIYYRPFNRNFSTGLSFHKVKQREYRQRLGFREYQTNTGHLAFYYDFEGGVSAQLFAGKYLAGDKGFTLDLARRYKSGFTLGVFATKTNVSKEVFGEGSFDKGFYFSIPTNLFYSDYRSGNISFGLHPLTKDAGSFLVVHNSLFSIFGDSNRKNIFDDIDDLTR